MAHWESDWGDHFTTEDDAREDAYNQMTESDFNELFNSKVSYYSLLEWARKQPNFFDDFSEEIFDVEEEYFMNNYKEVEDEEDDIFKY